jgi:hypothetical protein
LVPAGVIGFAAVGGGARVVALATTAAVRFGAGADAIRDDADGEGRFGATAVDEVTLGAIRDDVDGDGRFGATTARVVGAAADDATVVPPARNCFFSAMWCASCCLRTCKLCICNIARSSRSSAAVPLATGREPEPPVEVMVVVVVATVDNCDAAVRDRVPELTATAEEAIGEGVNSASRDRLRVNTGSRDGVVAVDAMLAADDERRRSRFGGTRPNMVCVSGLYSSEKSKYCGASNSNAASMTMKKKKKKKKKKKISNRCAFQKNNGHVRRVATTGAMRTRRRINSRFENRQPIGIAPNLALKRSHR